MYKNREVWIDLTKGFACILVALGHFFSSIMATEEGNGFVFLNWFVKTVYYFHVPLFFVCSGYLYQRINIKNRVLFLEKKLVELGIPFCFFSAAKFILKNHVENINDIINIIFVNPVPPYWYLYILFFLFLIIPQINKTIISLILLLISVVLRFLEPCIEYKVCYLISRSMICLIWFVLGMVIYQLGKSPKFCKFIDNLYCGIAMCILFMVSSTIEFLYDINNWVTNTILTFIIIFGVIIIFRNISSRFKLTNTQVIAEYSMPIYLIHTFFGVFFKDIINMLNLNFNFIIIMIGALFTVLGPCLLYSIVKKIWIFDFLFYPAKYIQFKK